MFNIKPIWFFQENFGIKLAIQYNIDIIKNTGGKTTLQEDVKINVLDSA